MTSRDTPFGAIVESSTDSWGFPASRCCSKRPSIPTLARRAGAEASRGARGIALGQRRAAAWGFAGAAFAEDFAFGFVADFAFAADFALRARRDGADDGGVALADPALHEIELGRIARAERELRPVVRADRDIRIGRRQLLRLARGRGELEPEFEGSLWSRRNRNTLFFTPNVVDSSFVPLHATPRVTSGKLSAFCGTCCIVFCFATREG